MNLHEAKQELASLITDQNELFNVVRDLRLNVLENIVIGSAVLNCDRTEYERMFAAEIESFIEIEKIGKNTKK